MVQENFYHPKIIKESFRVEFKAKIVHILIKVFKYFYAKMPSKNLLNHWVEFKNVKMVETWWKTLDLVYETLQLFDFLGIHPHLISVWFKILVHQKVKSVKFFAKFCPLTFFHPKHILCKYHYRS